MEYMSFKRRRIEIRDVIPINAIRRLQEEEREDQKRTDPSGFTELQRLRTAAIQHIEEARNEEKENKFKPNNNN